MTNHTPPHSNPPIVAQNRMYERLVTAGVVLALAIALAGVVYGWEWAVEIGKFVAAGIVVHLLYHFLLAHDHRAELADMKQTIMATVSGAAAEMHVAVANEIGKLASAAAFCRTFGIDLIADKDIQPLDSHALVLMQKDDKVVCIGRTLCHLLRAREQEIAEAIRRGVTFELCVCDYTYCLQIYEQYLMKASAHDYRTFFDVLLSLEETLNQDGACEGSLTLYFHRVYLPDTLLAFHRKDGGNVAYWIPSFGATESQKVTVKLIAGLGGSKMHEHLEARFRRVLCDHDNPHRGMREPTCVLGKGKKGKSAQQLRDDFDEYFKSKSEKQPSN